MIEILLFRCTLVHQCCGRNLDGLGFRAILLRSTICSNDRFHCNILSSNAANLVNSKNALYLPLVLVVSYLLTFRPLIPKSFKSKMFIHCAKQIDLLYSSTDDVKNRRSIKNLLCMKRKDNVFPS